MLKTRGYATEGPTSKLAPFTFERREPGPHDVLIQIAYCGICHSDIHQARDEWGGAIFPMVPGHEIVGRVTRVGANVTRFKVGDPAAVGCFVDSCRTCESCRNGEEQFCEVHTAFTYNGTEMDTKTPTFGGYSSQIVVDERYVLTISPKLPPANVAPLLCAGITTYAPLRQYEAGPGRMVGVVGLGGLGHMGVKLAAAMGAEVTVFTTSRSKERDARRLGAHQVVVTTEPGALDPLANRFHMILDTVSAPHDINAYLNLLRRDGTLALVGAPPQPLAVQPFQLIMKRRALAGSLIGGMRQTQEMLDFCSAKNITADVEVIPMQQVDTAYERTIKGDVRYRFVIDMNTL
ncbi:MAG: hydroxyacid dehydrogenase [Nitrospirae bacterium RIFCSPLOWO2_02_FULL_62_14]|nr:MAG: hydroxyacid dehydrogenase [Nitrospirae bacterium RIFCSPLOWO2_02_FULL_62_14]